MITPTQKWRKYRAERGICINEDCEKVIQKYLAPNFEGKIQLILTLNCTPFVRQYDILSKKWGVLLCQKEYQTNDIRRSSREWL